ncbi:ubiquitin-domain-containing protein [Morchella conica CCBAS932]|uniref:Ubiquitin-domain-containing protein n=1 Tax=Morchella conica CCBAS932 TaxID=1392247 RepID=A0A3N4KUN3_9PEZI|nr:ubiquitin-domain-containing protein [Morchella conica CCBAS932]
MSSNENSSERPSSPSEAPPAEPVTFSVKLSNDNKFPISLPPNTSVLDLKKRLAELSDVPADRQRLIYSGRVMKDEETIGTYKIQSGHTVHMVREAANRPGVPVNLAAGTGNNPLAGLTGARYAGHVQLPSAEMFGPDGGMGPPPDPEQLAQAMNNPQFASTMNEMLRNPQLLDYIIASNPMLQSLGPEARRLMNSDMFRQMMTNPDVLRQMGQMGGSLGGRGFGGMGGAPAPSFPEPGRTDTTPAPAGPEGPTTNTNQPAAGQPNPFGAAGGANPFAALFGGPPPASGANAQSPGAGGVPPHPFGINPALLGMLGGMNPAAGGQQAPLFDPATMNALLGAMGQGGAPYVGSPPPQTPADTRPPEERYAEQLRQLNDMGFFDFDRNVEALRRSGGSVQGAINQLLGG